MRLNDTISPSDVVSAESKQFLIKAIEAFKYNPPAPLSVTPDEESLGEMSEFFEKYYVPLDSGGVLPTDCASVSKDVSSYEQSIIDFCISPHPTSRICIFHGHTGVGKTTLLLRVFYYLYPRCPSLRTAFIPVYLPISPDLSRSTSDILYKKIMRLICSHAYKNVLRPEIKNHLPKILSELNEKGRFYGRFPEKDLSHLAADGEAWMNHSFPTDEGKDEFAWEVLRLMIRQRRTRIILVVDDVDQYSPSVHMRIFLTLVNLNHDGILSIVGMRTSTYENAAAKSLAHRDKIVELKLSPPLIEQILRRRVEVLRDSISLSPDIVLRIPKYEQVSSSDVIGSLTSLISKSPCQKALISLSNTNLKSVFLKLELMVRSEAFSDAFIVHQLLERDVVREEELRSSKIWVFYHLLLGNYAGTYQKSPEAHKAGLVNIFDSSELSQNPWKHFMRLNILMHSYKMWRMTRNDETFVPIGELFDKFKHAFGTCVEDSIFLDALWTLIESELVFMRSCRKYSKESFERDIFDDSIRVSTAGRFYLDNLLHKVEYLFFIKDDIDWRVEIGPLDLKPARRDYGRQVKFTEVLKAVRILMEEEFRCLANLRAYWISTENGNDGLARYRDHFSPYGIPEVTGMSFCEALLRSYKRFMKARLGSSFVGSDVGRLITEMENLGGQNEGLKQTYIAA